MTGQQPYVWHVQWVFTTATTTVTFVAYGTVL